jgi:uncharacterized protein with ParB-like and HNH nuclease domain
MINNILKLKPICEIIKAKTHFFVDTYQRGYKWDKQQVNDLLKDINEFEIASRDDFYCLQPVVVKKKDNKTELVDGQQRMTTIFIILSFLDKEKFTIDYQTRENSARFLNDIISNNKIQVNEWKDFKNEENDNIDNYHFFNAYVAIKEWFNTKSDDEKTLFHHKLTYNTQVIWYEVIEGIEDSEKIKSQELFARINIGKIPLTNSELIKALFLSDKDVDEVTKNEIAMEWDIIENTLQNDVFWYFITDKKSYPNTRIDLIFDMISDKNREDKKIDELFSFRFFNEKRKKTIDYWYEVTKLISLFQDWFDDVELFHLIGYSIETSGKNKLKYLINQYYKENSSKNFLCLIEKEIMNSDAIKRFDELQYDSNLGLVKNVLLLFNIKTHIKISNKDNFQRFPFKSYKNNKWSIEHIHAQNSEGLNQKEQWDEWLKQAIAGLQNIEEVVNVKDLINEIKFEKESELTKEKFQILFDKVQKISSDTHSNEELHTLDNLALLDGSTNSSISNNIFAVKRNMIVKAEKNNIFIPICTKNVFLKYYSEKPKHIFFWSNKDREDYLDNMKNILGIQSTKKIIENV